MVTIKATLTDAKLGLRQIFISGQHVRGEWAPPPSHILKPSVILKDEIANQHLVYKNTTSSILRGIAAKVENAEVLNTREVPHEKTIRNILKYAIQKDNGKGDDFERVKRLCNTVFKDEGILLHFHDPGNDILKIKLVIALPEALKTLIHESRGTELILIDAKHDTNMYRMPVIALNALSLEKRTFTVSVAVVDRENEENASLLLEAVRKNAPCSDANCEHPFHYISQGNTIVRITPCSQEQSFCPPITMMDKHRGVRLAVVKFGSQPILCNFHVMEAHNAEVAKIGIDQIFRELLAMCFKVIVRSQTTNQAWQRFNILRENIHILVIPAQMKEKYISYLEKNWMSNTWLEAIIDGTRLDHLSSVTTNNGTERLFRGLDEEGFGGKVNHTLSSLLRMFTGINPNGKRSPTTGMLQLHLIRLKQDDLSSRPLPQDMRERYISSLVLVLQGAVSATDADHIYKVKKLNVEEEGNELLGIMRDTIKPGGEAVSDDSDSYIANTRTFECTCMEFISKGPVRNKCKHVQASLMNFTRDEAIEQLANALKRKPEFVEANDLSTANKYMASLDLPLLPAEVGVVSYIAPKTGRPPQRKVKRPWRRSSLPSTRKRVKPRRANPVHSQDFVDCVCGVKHNDKEPMISCDGEGCFRWSHMACHSISLHKRNPQFFCHMCQKTL